jgi:glutathione S-transferase
MHPLVALVTVVALMLFAWQGIRVGSARSRYGVEAPATTGHPDFERHFRVHANTLEGLMQFLPSLWLFAIFLNDWIAAGLGAVWIIGRIVYTIGYTRQASQRGLGFGIQALAGMALLLGAGGAIVWTLIRTHLHA